MCVEIRRGDRRRDGGEEDYGATAAKRSAQGGGRSGLYSQSVVRAPRALSSSSGSGSSSSSELRTECVDIPKGSSILAERCISVSTAERRSRAEHSARNSREPSSQSLTRRSTSSPCPHRLAARKLVKKSADRHACAAPVLEQVMIDSGVRITHLYLLNTSS